MEHNLTKSKDNGTPYLTFSIAEQWFALPPTSIQDVMYIPKLAPVPLAHFDVAGLINIRGHIVTAIHSDRFFNMRREQEHTQKKMCIVLKHYDDELYSFIVDKVSDIEPLPTHQFEALPSSLIDAWSTFSSYVCPLESRTLIILDKEKMLSKLL